MVAMRLLALLMKVEPIYCEIGSFLRNDTKSELALGPGKFSLATLVPILASLRNSARLNTFGLLKIPIGLAIA